MKIYIAGRYVGERDSLGKYERMNRFKSNENESFERGKTCKKNVSAKIFLKKLNGIEGKRKEKGKKPRSMEWGRKKS